MIDLHTHSTASDGELSPKDLVSLAIEKDIDVVASEIEKMLIV